MKGKMPSKPTPKGMMPPSDMGGMMPKSHERMTESEHRKAMAAMKKGDRK